MNTVLTKEELDYVRNDEGQLRKGYEEMLYKIYMEIRGRGSAKPLTNFMEAIMVTDAYSTLCNMTRPDTWHARDSIRSFVFSARR